MRRFLAIVFICFAIVLNAELIITNSLSFGGNGDDVGNDIIVLADGSIVVAGYTSSTEGLFYSKNGQEDFLIAKFDDDLNLLWWKAYGGSRRDIAESIVQSKDGGFVVVGLTESSDGDVSTSDRLGDFWVICLSPEGDLLWEETFGGSSQDHAYDVIVSREESIIVAGYTRSNDGDVIGHVWGEDFWIIELSFTGELIRQWTIDGGNNNEDLARKLIQLETGEIYVTGYSAFKDVGISCNYVNVQAAIACIDNEGNLSWYLDYGDRFHESAYDLIFDQGNLMIVGEMDAGTSMFSSGLGGKDFWILSIDLDGEELWSKEYGGTLTDTARSINRIGENRFAVAGYTTSRDINVKGSRGMNDGWIIVVDSAGKLLEARTAGGSGDDLIFASALESGQAYFAGYTTSTDGDLEINAGGRDLWILSVSISK
ncbi:hypothetical protein [uncultured Mesotoga sp.]|jgi:hypothetical protein|uniref:hypothetical protein n=1 Tax=uncultured Mesotoga sp. TaxID=1184400 RepID=UPI002595C32B|nr:hypothetical protein [uncultured Mesotoga sp.]